MHNISIVSGGFDPPHVGHGRLIWNAGLYNIPVVIILNNDNWLMAKKGFIFMPQEEREELLRYFTGVKEVLLSFHEPNPTDTSVVNELLFLRNKYSAKLGWNPAFCNGGDRKKGCLPTAEERICQELNIKMLYNVGGEKVQSSSELVEKAKGRSRTVLELE
jgi:D-beta-D-heptose 7-phosphate kinase/D-beta-D-heptose 1-phosphate adenosyltransferase